MYGMRTTSRLHRRPTLGQRLSPLVEECEALLAEMRRITSPEDVTDEEIDETLLEIAEELGATKRSP